MASANYGIANNGSECRMIREASTALTWAAQLWRVAPSTLTAVRIKHGLTNESFSITGGPEDVVVRISITDEHALQLDRTSEEIVLDLVEQAGIGAAVLLCNPQARVLITRQLPGRTLQLAELSSEQNIARLAQLLRQLHSLPVPATVQTIDLTTVLHGYWNELDAVLTSDNQYDNQQIQQRQLALEVAAESALQPRRCLCHNDVHHLNLIDNDERLWLLDWEYAGIGDPYFDLASVCCYHDFNESQRNWLLTHYAAAAFPTDQARLQRMCWLFDYIKALWFAVREG